MQGFPTYCMLQMYQGTVALESFPYTHAHIHHTHAHAYTYDAHTCTHTSTHTHIQTHTHMHTYTAYTHAHTQAIKAITNIPELVVLSKDGFWNLYHDSIAGASGFTGLSVVHHTHTHTHTHTHQIRAQGVIGSMYSSLGDLGNPTSNSVRKTWAALLPHLQPYTP